MDRAYLPLFVFLLLTHGLRAQFGQPDLYLAQVAIGAGTSTSFSIHNPTNAVIEVRVEIRGSVGTKILEFDPLIEIPAGGTRNVAFAGGINWLSGGQSCLRLNALMPPSSTRSWSGKSSCHAWECFPVHW